ncbi:hypothetical protein TeGR_g1248 [Tetraparma gracilis]|uniref:Uncharacterized protein n=1 Tax=Tetraparma gracilis TaxID=2962635 RepID=A0ABQ6ME00_9STRA|nr:hypothetical protein TeGR_g1248 [Tetraparma gracilis]
MLRSPKFRGALSSALQSATSWATYLRAAAASLRGLEPPPPRALLLSALLNSALLFRLRLPPAAWLAGAVSVRPAGRLVLAARVIASRNARALFRRLRLSRGPKHPPPQAR